MNLIANMTETVPLKIGTDKLITCVDSLLCLFLKLIVIKIVLPCQPKMVYTDDLHKDLQKF